MSVQPTHSACRGSPPLSWPFWPPRLDVQGFNRCAPRGQFPNLGSRSRLGDANVTRGQLRGSRAVCAAVAAPSASAQVPLPIGGAPSGGSQQPEPAPAPQQERRPRIAALGQARDHARPRRCGGPQVRTRPSSRSKRITRLRLDTEDGYPEVYLALRSYTGADGKAWIECGCQCARTGVRAGCRGPRSAGCAWSRPFLQIDRRRLRATLYRGGKRIWSSRVGVGERSTPTPAGDFWIREKLGPLRPGTDLRPARVRHRRVLATQRLARRRRGWDPRTNQPGLIPGRPSHGCVRVRNGPIRKLGRLMPVGTPVQIL